MLLDLKADPSFKEDASLDESGSRAHVLRTRHWLDSSQNSWRLPAWPDPQGPTGGPSVWFPSTCLHTESAIASLASSLFLELSQNITWLSKYALG